MFLRPDVSSVCSWIGGLMLAGISALLAQGDASLPVVYPRDGDQVVLLGGGQVEEMGHQGWLQTALHLAFPETAFRVHHLGRAGDRVDWHPREPGSPSLWEDLEGIEPAHVLGFYGFNESFAESEGLEEFEEGFRNFVQRLEDETEAKLTFISPTPSDGIPQSMAINARLSLYHQSMERLSAELEVGYMDAWTHFDEDDFLWPEEWTSNGIHLNSHGHWQLAKFLAWEFRLPEARAREDALDAGDFRELVLERNQIWRDRQFPINGQLISGALSDSRKAAAFSAESILTEEKLAGLDERIREAAKPPLSTLWKEAPAADAIPPRPSSGVAPPKAVEVLPPTESLQHLEIHEDFQIDAWATEESFPMVNPIDLRVDAEGRVWVLCSPDWPHPWPGTPPGDYVLVLEDLDRDGIADQSRVFVSGLQLPTSLLPVEGGVLVAEPRSITRYLDSNGDGEADRRISELVGFGTGHVEQLVQLREAWPNGRWLFSQGAGALSHLETAWGPLNIPGSTLLQKTSDGLELLPLAKLETPHTLVRESWGKLLISDGDDGSIYALNPEPGTVRKASEAGGAFLPLDTWAAPDNFQGNLVRANSEELSLWARQPARYGIAWSALEKPLLTSSDPAFQPVCLRLGPDGSLFVLDFCSPVLRADATSMHASSRDHGHGRIWRISSLLEYPSWQKTAATIDVDTWLKDLAHPEARHTEFAMARLLTLERDRLEQDLTSWWTGADSKDTLHAPLLRLRQLAELPNAALLEEVIGTGDAPARYAAAQALAEWWSDLETPLRVLKPLLLDENQRVRQLAVAIANRNSQYDAVADAETQLTEWDEATTEDLLEVSETPAVAAILFERIDTPADVHFTVAERLAQREGIILAEYLIQVLQEENPDTMPVGLLLPKLDPWELHFRRRTLTRIATTSSSQSAREVAWAALGLASLANVTLPTLLQSLNDLSTDAESELLLGAARLQVPALREALLPRVMAALEAEDDHSRLAAAQAVAKSMSSAFTQSLIQVAGATDKPTSERFDAVRTLQKADVLPDHLTPVQFAADFEQAEAVTSLLPGQPMEIQFSDDSKPLALVKASDEELPSPLPADHPGVIATSSAEEEVWRLFAPEAGDFLLLLLDDPQERFAIKVAEEEGTTE